MTTIWGRYMDRKPEKVDTLSPREAQRCFGEYLLAFGALRGQHNYKKWKLWMGRLKDEPSDREYYGNE